MANRFFEIIQQEKYSSPEIIVLSDQTIFEWRNEFGDEIIVTINQDLVYSGIIRNKSFYGQIKIEDFLNSELALHLLNFKK